MDPFWPLPPPPLLAMPGGRAVISAAPVLANPGPVSAAPVSSTTTAITPTSASAPQNPTSTFQSSFTEKPTIVFIGKIPDGVHDEWIEKLLRTCGPLQKWKRLKDASEDSRPCGFALFEGKEGAARALRVLAVDDGLELPSPLPSRPSRKLKVTVDSSIKKKLEETPGDDMTIREELPKLVAELADSTVAALMNKTDKTKNAEFLANAVNYGNRNVLDDLKDDELPAEQREMIRSEIRSFRTNAAIRDKAREESKFREEFERRAREERERDRERERNKMRGIANSSGGVGGPNDRRASDIRVQERGSWTPFSNNAGVPMIVDEEDEEAEARKEEIRKKDEEMAFKERERRWEAREEHKERERAEEKARDEQWLAKRQQERIDIERFLREYDDEEAARNGEDFYINRERWFQRRANFRLREQDQDARDRRLAQQEAERLKKQAAMQSSNGSTPTSSNRPRFASNGDLVASDRPRREMSVDLEDEAGDAADAAPVVIGRIMTREERNAAKKDLIESLPVDKEGLFGWKIKWNMVDQDMIKDKFKPWVTKKMAELTGEEPQDLISSIVTSIPKQVPAARMLDDLTLPLDDEAELFVIKLWRVLIFETESRAAGLS
ncbi:hypothetical protein SeMB42_g06597 [Synchytrium endobioticum]|uniref:PWI domain-containing protein n=1 Tax=Synchytrium endobioticum TaxID=286115 RepID=A0A507CRX5_9FUNG|nr:hypothetical protein SeMB42_g06597 [Synchytrium endobioticum]TPX41889.1 hypothetical protein SeLEV6574_g05869 [Synchytrium endobioticum]